MWRADTKQWKAVMVDCPKGLYPNDDADGCPIFDNTHYTTAKEAWDSLEAEASAHVTMAARSVEYKRDELARANEEAADASIRWKTFRDNQEKWQRSE